jgi:predicted dehydrogenase
MTATVQQPGRQQTAADRLPVIVVGAGAMGGDWMKMVAAAPTARLVGVVDLDLDVADAAVRRAGVDGVLTGDSLEDVARRTGALGVINVTVPQAHRVVNEQALRAGLPVLCEKPLAPTVAEALRQVALANVTEGLLMVSQSRRYNSHLAAFRSVIRELGPLATVTADFFHEDHEPGFRERMAHPLLLDMSIHHFDMLRSAVDDEPLAVRCSSWNPSWSWYDGDAAASAEFELTSGARFVYAGSRCTRGLETSFNADWRVYGEDGAGSWDGETTLRRDPVAGPIDVTTVPEGIAGALADFVDCLGTGATPQNEVRANVRSLAMVEAAMRSSAAGGARVVIPDLIDDALEQAIADERDDDVLAELRSWTSATEALTTKAWGSASALTTAGATR